MGTNATESTLTNPTTEDELATALNTAVSDGNLEEVERLMTFELPEPPAKEEEEEPEEEVIPDEVPDDKTNEEPTEVVEEGEQKEEAATEPDAASKPEETVEEKDDNKDRDAELHRLRSEVGRLPYLRRRTQELERELRDAKLNRTVGSPDPNAAPNNAKPVIPESLQKRLTALKDIDPDLAETLEETINALRQDHEQRSSALIKEVTEANDARDDEEFIREQYQVLTTKMPMAPEIFASPEWKSWKTTLTPARLAFATSVYADEVEVAIQAFLNDMQARVQHESGTAPVQAATTPVPTQEPAPVVSKVQEARNRKMATGASTPSSVAAKTGSVQLDEEKQFSEFYKQVQKENHLG